MAQYLLFRRKVLNHRKDIDEIDITIMYYISEKNKQNLEMTKQLFLPPHEGEIKRASNGTNANRVRIRKRHPEIPDPQIPHHEDQARTGKDGALFADRHGDVQSALSSDG